MPPFSLPLEAFSLTLPSLHPELDYTLGAVFIADVVVAILTGATALQCITYFRSKNDDRQNNYRRIEKSVIALLWLLDVAQLFLATFTVYHYAITNFGDPSVLFHIPWSLSCVAAVGGVSDLLVSCMLLHRIWKLSNHCMITNTMLAVCTVICFAVLAGDASITMLTLRSTMTYALFHHKYGWIWYATFGGRACADAAITVWTCVYLHKSRKSVQRARTILRSLIVYTANTCAVTTIFVVVTVITFAAFPNNFIGIATSMILPKLMLNSLLAMLNSRGRMRDDLSRTPTHTPRSTELVNSLTLVPPPSNSGHRHTMSLSAAAPPAPRDRLRQQPSRPANEFARADNASEFIQPYRPSMSVLPDAYPVPIQPNLSSVFMAPTRLSAVSPSDSRTHLNPSPSTQPGACFFDTS